MLMNSYHVEPYYSHNSTKQGKQESSVSITSDYSSGHVHEDSFLSVQSLSTTTSSSTIIANEQLVDSSNSQLDLSVTKSIVYIYNSTKRDVFSQRYLITI